MKIGQHLPKSWAIKYRVVFLMKHGVYLGRTRHVSDISIVLRGTDEVGQRAGAVPSSGLHSRTVLRPGPGPAGQLPAAATVTASSPAATRLQGEVLRLPDAGLLLHLAYVRRPLIRYTRRLRQLRFDFDSTAIRLLIRRH